jgi:putative phosphoesterase
VKIGILSDTHTRIDLAKESLDLLMQNGAEFIIHAGDIVEEAVLQLLKECGLRYVAVYGNNDPHLAYVHRKYNLVQEPHYFKLADTKFKLMHLPYYLTPDTEVVIFGHTHKFECEFKGGTLFINPGESCARNKKISECVLLEVQEEKFFVNYFHRPLSEGGYSMENYQFERLQS